MELTQTGCPTRDQLRQLLGGSGTGDAFDPLREHVQSCRHCQKVLDEWPVFATESGAAGAGTQPAAPAAPVPAGAADGLPAIPGYEILGRLGGGGMGMVYKARQVRPPHRVVALKLLRPGGPEAAELRERFRLEVEALVRLQHPHIVPVFEVGDLDQTPYFTMELLGGGSLSDQRPGEPRPPGEAADLIAVLARAVGFGHGRGILHRDLKPANVLLTDDGTPKVADFGLAKLSGEGPGVTHTGMILGTPCYMAPEQAAGRAKGVGPAADVYSLGAILYQLLTGRPPFHGGTAGETVRLVLAADPVPPRRLRPAVPRDLEAVCLRCLEKDPACRYPSAEALADDLARFLAGRPTAARPLGATGRAWRWARRNPAAAGLALAAVLVIAGVVGGALAFASQKRRHAADLLGERDRVREERDRAAANFRTSLQAYRMLLDKVEGLELTYRATADQQKQVEEVIQFFEPLVREEPGNAEYRHILAKAWHFRGKLCHGQPESVAAYRRSFELFEPLEVDPVRGPMVRLLNGNNANNLGMLAGQTVDPEGVGVWFRRATDRLGPLAREYPENREYTVFLANALINWSAAELTGIRAVWSLWPPEQPVRERILRPAVDRLREADRLFRSVFPLPSLLQQLHGFRFDLCHRYLIDAAELVGDPAGVRQTVKDWVGVRGYEPNTHYQAAYRIAALYKETRHEPDAAWAVKLMEDAGADRFQPRLACELANHTQVIPLREYEPFRRLLARRAATELKEVTTNTNRVLAAMKGQVTVLASTEQGDWPATRLIDDDPFTYWVSAAGDSKAKGKTPRVELQFPEEATIGRVTVLGQRGDSTAAVTVFRIKLLGADGTVLKAGTVHGKEPFFDADWTLPAPVEGVSWIVILSLADNGDKNTSGSVALGEILID